MKVTYLGTAAAEGVPAVFCNCKVCKEARERGGRNIRTRAQVLIDGELSIDFPPDAYLHSLHCGTDLSAIKYLLVSHAHMDHFSPMEFVLRGSVFAHEMTSPTIDIYANATVLEIYREQTRREYVQPIADAIRLHEIKPFETVTFGDYTVHTLPANHSSPDPMLFLIEKGEKSLLQLYDTARLPESAFAALEKIGKCADLINFDCTHLFCETGKAARHMNMDDVQYTFGRLLAIGAADENTKKIITHFSHNGVPTEENIARAEREYGVTAAYDGFSLEI